MKHANLDTEWVVIGALLDCEGPPLKSTADALISASALNVEDFSSATTRGLFEVIRTLAERQRSVDADTVWSVGRGMAWMPKEGRAKLSEIQGANSCDRNALLTHAQELRRLTKLRQLEAFHEEQLKAVQSAMADPTVLATNLDQFTRRFSGAEEDFGTGEQDLFELMEEWDAAATGVRKPYLPTGIEALDHEIMGWEENLNLIGGPPSILKSGLAAAAIYNALLDGHRICLFGLEDGTKWIAKRLVSRRIGLPLKHVGKVRLRNHEQASLQEAMGELANPLRNLLTYKRGGLGTGRLVQLCKKAIAVHKVRAIFIDHGLEVQHEGLSKGDELRTRVQNTFAQLRNLAFTTHTPVVVVVHFNREQAKLDGPPTMHNFAECAGIERMARLALGLWEREEDGPDKVRCTVIKQTEGARNVHLFLRREPEHALIANQGGGWLDLKAEREAKRMPSWRVHPAPAEVANGAG
jgi:replicative DNA helicase